VTRQRRLRSAWVLVGGVAIAVGVIAFARGGDRSARIPRSGARATGAVAVAPAPPVVARSSDSPGPAGSDGVVPVGFARTAAGAAAAATSYLSAMHRLVLLNDGERELALRRMAVPGADAVVTGGMEALRGLDAVVADARTAQQGARLLLREVPIAYRVGPVDTDRARVDVWSVAVVLIEGRTQASEVWATTTVDLAWAAGDWRLAAWSRAAGPVPAAGRTEPTPSDRLLAAIDGWEGYRYVPSS
jgi:hypothetical protein